MKKWILLTLCTASFIARSACPDTYQMYIKPTYNKNLPRAEKIIYQQEINEQINTSNIIFKKNGICLQLISLEPRSSRNSIYNINQSLRTVETNRDEMEYEDDLIVINAHFLYSNTSNTMGMANVLQRSINYLNKKKYNIMINMARLGNSRMLYNSILTHEIGHLMGLKHNNLTFHTIINNQDIRYQTIMNSAIPNSYAFASNEIEVNNEPIMTSDRDYYYNIDEVILINERLDELFEHRKIEILKDSTCCIKSILKAEIKGGIALMPKTLSIEENDLIEEFLINNKTNNYRVVSEIIEIASEYNLKIKSVHD